MPLLMTGREARGKLTCHRRIDERYALARSGELPQVFDVLPGSGVNLGPGEAE
jgi:hypothetical protein